MRQWGEAEILAAVRHLEGAVHDYGRAFGTDNEALDAELALAYADRHKPRP